MRRHVTGCLVFDVSGDSNGLAFTGHTLSRQVRQKPPSDRTPHENSEDQVKKKKNAKKKEKKKQEEEEKKTKKKKKEEDEGGGEISQEHSIKLITLLCLSLCSSLSFKM